MTIGSYLERRVGFQSLFDFTDAVEAVQFAAQHGLRAVELNLGNQHYREQLRRERARARIRNAAQRYGIALLVHSVDGLSLFSSDRRQLRRNIEFLRQFIEDSDAAGARHFTLHLGYDMAYGYVHGKMYTYEAYPDSFAQNLSWALGQLAKTETVSMTLGIENVGGFRYPWVYPILHQHLGGRLRLTMDVGHVNVFRSHVRRQELDFFKRHTRLIRSSHVHDNDGTQDQHYPIGKGNIDFLPFFRLLARARAYIIFEVRPKEAALECLRQFREDYV
ncbi:MAG: TIM barrel protein, partial [candidate division WOR-3 bacterium]